MSWNETIWGWNETFKAPPNPNLIVIPWITSYPLDNDVQGAAVAQEFLGIIPRGEIQGLQQLPPHLI